MQKYSMSDIQKALDYIKKNSNDVNIDIVNKQNHLEILAFDRDANLIEISVFPYSESGTLLPKVRETKRL